MFRETPFVMAASAFDGACSNRASVDATLALERILSSTFEKPVNEKALEPRNFPSLETLKDARPFAKTPTLLEQSS